VATRPRKRKYTRGRQKSIIFRGKRYWFYGTTFLKYGKALSPDIRRTMATLHKLGYRTRIIRPPLSWNMVDIYTNPKILDSERHTILLNIIRHK